MNPVDAVLNDPDLRIGILSHTIPKYSRKQVDFSSYLMKYAHVSKAWNTDAKIAKQMWVERDFVPFCTYGGLETVDNLREFILERKFAHVNLSEDSCCLMDLPNIRINDLVLLEILKGCGNLQSLNLTMTGITDEIVPKIFNYVPKLQILILNDCPISDLAFFNLPQENYLQSLSLSRYAGLSEAGIERIFLIFSQLQSLTLNGMNSIDKDFIYIPEINQLKSLSIRSNPGITDLGINSILKKCASKLEIVNIAETYLLQEAVFGLF